MKRIRVVLGEDNFLAREGITSIIEAVEDMELVASCRDLDTLCQAIDEHQPDVVVTDIRMPPGSTDEGVRLAVRLRETHPRIGVVVLSQHVEPLYATAIFADGSYRRAYLLKERLKDANELEHAIREVAEGGALVDPRVVDELLSSRHDESKLRGLTAREREILSLIADGHSNAAIGDKLGITKRAVERHVHAIFVKLDLPESDGVSRRVKAALIFRDGD